MASSYITVSTLGSGTLVDTELVTVGGSSVHRQRVQIAGDASGDIADVSTADTADTVPGVAVRLVGQVAHDEADIGSPVKVGGKYAFVEPAASATGDRVNAWFQDNGALFTHRYNWHGNRLRVYGDTNARAYARTVLGETTITSTTAVIAAGATGVYTYVIGMILSNTHATTNGIVTFEKATGGADLFNVYLPAKTTIEIWAPDGVTLFVSGSADAINAVGASGQTIAGTFYHFGSSALLY